MVNSFPVDLAKAVHLELQRLQVVSPELGILVDLFEALYFASLKTEELQPITCYIVYLDPANPDPKPPKRILKDRWSCVRLVNPIPVTTGNLVKLAKASDPRTSSFAVYPDPKINGQLSIWGLIDQGNRHHDFLNHDVESGSARPGVFQASIVGIGHLVTYVGLEKIAELKANTLIGKTVDVLERGPIRDTLEAGIQSYRTTIERLLLEGDLLNPEDIDTFHFMWDVSLASHWISSLRRLLLRAQNLGHGGAILITPALITPNASPEGLNVKYRIDYPRLQVALESHALTNIQTVIASDIIMEQYLDEDAEDIPVWLHLDEVVGTSDLEESRSEIDGTIWFISLLTRVDGLVLMNSHLEVQGFGVEITYSNRPSAIAIAENQHATKIRQDSSIYDHYGTRHRSMMRYCSQVPNSVGFVISQDGDVWWTPLSRHDFGARS